MGANAGFVQGPPHIGSMVTLTLAPSKFGPVDDWSPHQLFAALIV